MYSSCNNLFIALHASETQKLTVRIIKKFDALLFPVVVTAEKMSGAAMYELVSI